jgi:hypothetical protein
VKVSFDEQGYGWAISKRVKRQIRISFDLVQETDSGIESESDRKEKANVETASLQQHSLGPAHLLNLPVILRPSYVFRRTLHPHRLRLRLRQKADHTDETIRLALSCY